MKKSKITGICILLLTSYATITKSEQITEPDICLEGDYHCLINNNGIVISKQDNLDNYTTTITSAALLFEDHFGIAPKPAAVVLGGEVNAEILAAFNDLDIKIILPWLTDADKRKIMTLNIRRQIKAQQPDLPDEIIERLVNQAIEATGESHENTDDVENGIIGHELAHLWYIEHFWKNYGFVEGQAGSNYGGPAPDWLDEMAASLSENNTMVEKRRQELKEIITHPSGPSLYPLSEFLKMEHPITAAKQLMSRFREEAAKEASGVKIQVFTTEEAQGLEMVGDPTIFYTQARGFADFMIEKTTDPQIFAKITKHLVNGGTIESWLKEYGSSFHLPSDIPTLEIVWLNWLEQID